MKLHRIEINSMLLQGCGIYVIPTLHISITYRMPKLIILIWSFRINVDFYYELPMWFMNIWDKVVNFNFKNNDKEREE